MIVYLLSVWITPHLIMMLLMAPYTHQSSVDPHTTYSSRVNFCFADPFSNQCLMLIAHLRGISLDTARSLIERAQNLYASEETSPTAVYDRTTLAIACLAGAGRVRPGPDSDCAACGPACVAESRHEVCELYCTNMRESTHVATTIGQSPYVLRSKSRLEVKESEILRDMALNNSGILIISAISILLAFSATILILMLIRFTVKNRRRRDTLKKWEFASGMQINLNPTAEATILPIRFAKNVSVHVRVRVYLPVQIDIHVIKIQAVH